MQPIELPAPPDSAVEARDDMAEAERPAAITAQVHGLCATLDALDREIAGLEVQVAVLPTVLATLAGHPVLWLLLGRVGVDRPGGLSTLVGQQVVTVARVDRRTLLAVGVVLLLIGLAMGVSLSLWYRGHI
jgi:hypothetical protein